MTNIISLVRRLLGDVETSNRESPDVFVYTSSNIFTLSEPNVTEILFVYINNVITTDYTYNSNTNELTITSSLTTKDIIKVVYSYYPNYSDTEIINYIYSSLIYLATHHYEDFIVESNNEIYPQPTSKEEKLIALITSTLIEPNNVGIRLPDLTINVPSDLPTPQKIAKIIGGFKKDTVGDVGMLGGGIND